VVVSLVCVGGGRRSLDHMVIYLMKVGKNKILIVVQFITIVFAHKDKKDKSQVLSTYEVLSL
jgi:hypothetical protein